MHKRQKIIKIKDCKERRHILVRSTDSRCTSAKEKKEQLEKCGTMTRLRNRKSEYEKTQKESMVCSTTQSEVETAMIDNKVQLPP